MTKRESTALKSLNNKNKIRILQADKGNCTVVLNESTYKEKISSLLEPEVYDTLSKNPTERIERKIRQLLTKHKTVLLFALKRKLTPYHSKPPHLYGLPKVHKPDIPLRPIVSSIDSPCYALSEFLHKILTPLVDNTDSFVKNTELLIKSIKDFNLQSEDCLVSFDVVSLFTNVPVEQVLQVIKNRLNTDSSFPERSPLQAVDVMELLDLCLKLRTSSLMANFTSKKMVWQWETLSGSQQHIHGIFRGNSFGHGRLQTH
jgi:hypothetical protein